MIADRVAVMLLRAVAETVVAALSTIEVTESLLIDASDVMFAERTRRNSRPLLTLAEDVNDEASAFVTRLRFAVVTVVLVARVACTALEMTAAIVVDETRTALTTLASDAFDITAALSVFSLTPLLVAVALNVAAAV